MPSFSGLSGKVTNIALAVVLVLIAIVGTVILINVTAQQGPALQGASNNTTNALTDGDWGSETANSLADSIGEVTPLAFVAMFLGMVLAPLGGAVLLVVRAYRDM